MEEGAGTFLFVIISRMKNSLFYTELLLLLLIFLSNTFRQIKLIAWEKLSLVTFFPIQMNYISQGRGLCSMLICIIVIIIFIIFGSGPAFLWIWKSFARCIQALLKVTSFFAKHFYIGPTIFWLILNLNSRYVRTRYNQI